VAKFNPEVGKKSRDKFLGIVLGFETWIVLSWEVRFYESEFSSGGNHGRYPGFIPKKQIWLEIGLTLKNYDLCGVTIHEALEAKILEVTRMTYNKAHEIADYYEKKFRMFTLENGWDDSWDVCEMADYWAKIYLEEITR